MHDPKSDLRARIESLKETFKQASEVDDWYESLKSAPISPAFSRRQILIAQKIPSFRESFEHFLDKNDIRTALVAGDCTDLCARELAMYLKFWANQHDRDMRVVIPENCVATFHLPQDVAHKIHVQPHPGDFYHRFALYEMARHKIEVVKDIL